MFDPNADPNYNPRNLTKPKTGAWQIYKRLLHYAWGYKRRLTLSLFFSLVVAGSFTSMILGVAAVVNVLYGDQTQLEERAAHTAAQFEKRIPDALRGMLPWSREELADGLKSVAQAMRADRGRTLRWLAAVFVTLGLFAGIARFFQEYFAGSIGVGVSTQLGDHMFGNVMKLSLRFFEQHPTGELLARFTNDIFMVNRGLTAVLVKLMQEPLKALFFLCVALSRDPVLTVVGLCVLPPIGYVMIRIGQHFKRNVRRSLERIASMAGVINEVFSGILIVKGFAMESYELKRVRNELYKLRRYLLRMVRADAAVGPLVEFVIIVGLVAFILYAGKRFESGGLMAGDLVAVVSALALMLDPVRKLSAVNNMIQTSVASAERVFEFIDLEPEVPEMRNAVPIKRLREALRLDNVSFSYDGKTEVLKDITCEIKKGEMVALVGFSGAGKTTLIKLIPRFYDPTHGSIRLDNYDIRRASFASLRGQIGIVTQETFLFNESVRDNITFGDQEISEERVRAAADAAQATEFIEKLPQGFDTVIGEGGVTLSGGQRQRLAIARAIIRDPTILILDEATSNLDSESERAIQRALEQFIVGRTTIVIAHRLSTIQRADRILVLDAGRIVEEGTHKELLDKGGLYRRLYEVQFGPQAAETQT